MVIDFRCDQCGRVYQADEAMAGKHVKGKQCNAIVQVPLPQAVPADDGPLEGLEIVPSGPVADWSTRVLAEIEKVFVGQRELVRGVLIALLAEGHVLIE